MVWPTEELGPKSLHASPNHCNTQFEWEQWWVPPASGIPSRRESTPWTVRSWEGTIVGPTPKKTGAFGDMCRFCGERQGPQCSKSSLMGHV